MSAPCPFGELTNKLGDTVVYDNSIFGGPSRFGGTAKTTPARPTSGPLDALRLKTKGGEDSYLAWGTWSCLIKPAEEGKCYLRPIWIVPSQNSKGDSRGATVSWGHPERAAPALAISWYALCRGTPAVIGTVPSFIASRKRDTIQREVPPLKAPANLTLNFFFLLFLLGVTTEGTRGHARCIDVWLQSILWTGGGTAS